MPSKLLAAAGLAALLAVAALGAWGWTGRDDARARHQAAVAARHQKEFCQVLGQPVGYLTGRILDRDAPVGLPAQPPSDLDLANSAPMLLYFFDDTLLRDAPPAVRREVALMGDVAREVARTSSSEPFQRPAVRRAIATLTAYFEANCA